MLRASRLEFSAKHIQTYVLCLASHLFCLYLVSLLLVPYSKILVRARHKRVVRPSGSEFHLGISGAEQAPLHASPWQPGVVE
jgi:hypothetical protein